MQDDNNTCEVVPGLTLENFEVVRREFFAHINEPSVTFNNFKFYPNTACLKRFDTVDFVQVLINTATKTLALRSCTQNDRDSYCWCTYRRERRTPKQITCRMFFMKVFELMNWNAQYRYKLLGRPVQANGEQLMIFDLTATEVYERISKNSGKPVSRKPAFPEDWKHRFGLPYAEHMSSVQINLFDGYAVYAIKEENTERVLNVTTDTDGGHEYE